MRLKSSYHRIAAYYVTLEVVLGKTAKEARESPHWTKQVGPYRGDYYALCTNREERVVLFFGREHLNHGVINHEILHATLNILCFHRAELDLEKGQEMVCVLHQHLSDLVYGDLKRWKAKIKL